MSYVNMGGILWLSMRDFGESLGWRQAYLGLGSVCWDMYHYLSRNSTCCFVKIHGPRRGDRVRNMIFTSMPLYKKPNQTINHFPNRQQRVDIIARPSCLPHSIHLL